MLDIAIPQDTGFLANSIEECLCPRGYEGYSCEACARGYYRDNFNRIGSVGSCKPCDCNGNEVRCQDSGVCVCKEDFEGQKCERPASQRPSSMEKNTL
jgi:hypothetical protein